MNAKSLLIGILSLIVFVCNAQTDKVETNETKTVVTELKMETDDFDELVNIDWNEVKEIFLKNDSDQDITLSYAYVNKSEIEKSKYRLNNFKFTLTGKTEDLDQLISNMKNLINEMDKLTKKS